ncbi:MAG: hypothetical protein AB8C95_03120 [Phycisphaeraceae bacterium]
MTKLMNLLFAPALASALLLAGCGSGASDHDHDHDHDHDDHEAHSEDGGYGHSHDSANEHGLGEIKIADSVFDVTLGGEPSPNAAIHIDLEIKSGPTPAAIRVWVGDLSATGSVKGKAIGANGDYHADVTCPAELAQDAAIWIEVESADGTRTAGSLAIDHDHK